MPVEYLVDEVDDISGATLALMVSADYYRSEVGSRLGIGLSGLKVIGFLNRYGGMTAGELAKAVDLTSGSMTATIDKLESQGMVVRRRGETDRRSVTVLITPEGTRAMGWVLHHYRTALGGALSSIPEADHEAVSAYLAAAAASIREIADRIPNLSREA